jgi:hypothetical protein
MLKVLDRAYLDLTTSIGRGIIAFLSAMAEDERQRIVARANGGRQIARARGVKFGLSKPPSDFYLLVSRQLRLAELCTEPVFAMADFGKPHRLLTSERNLDVDPPHSLRQSRLIGKARCSMNNAPPYKARGAQRVHGGGSAFRPTTGRCPSFPHTHAYSAWHLISA